MASWRVPGKRAQLSSPGPRRVAAPGSAKPWGVRHTVMSPEQRARREADMCGLDVGRRTPCDVNCYRGSSQVRPEKRDL